MTPDAGQKTPCGGTGGPTRARTTLRRRGHRVPGSTGDSQDKRLAVLLHDDDVVYR
ncbi:unnamed protein product [Dibothriocephalus latus]|uniref:Uncharacterized protein n=1 Tax=Dibothriocephalus latus TaxID=60516 RepID=A0A3P7NBJ2_DIBLA|nr:unnamed protein product [Dibothriocephalus latus]